MEFDAYLDAVERESAALRSAATRGPLDAVVPTCPEWTLGELVGHVRGTQRWAMLNVQRATPAAHVPFDEVGDAPTGPAVIDAFATTTSELVSTLRDTGPEAPTWTFRGAPVSGFWRGAALEVAVHRWDGENAVGIAQPIDAPLAVDGIDEFLDFVPAFMAPKFEGTSGTMHVHSTDADGEWLVDFDADGLVVTREHAKGDVAARGPASDLLLVLYGRVVPGTVDVHGDGALVERWQQVATL